MGEMNTELEDRSTSKRNCCDIYWSAVCDDKMNSLVGLLGYVNARDMEASPSVPGYAKSKQNVKTVH